MARESQKADSDKKARAGLSEGRGGSPPPKAIKETKLHPAPPLPERDHWSP